MDKNIMLKTVFSISIISLCNICGHARTWTDTSNRTIDGKFYGFCDDFPAKYSVVIEKENGRRIWCDVTKLSNTDIEWIYSNLYHRVARSHVTTTGYEFDDYIYKMREYKPEKEFRIYDFEVAECLNRFELLVSSNARKYIDKYKDEWKIRIDNDVQDTFSKPRYMRLSSIAGIELGTSVPDDFKYTANGGKKYKMAYGIPSKVYMSFKTCCVDVTYSSDKIISIALISENDVDVNLVIETLGEKYKTYLGKEENAYEYEYYYRAKEKYKDKQRTIALYKKHGGKVIIELTEWRLFEESEKEWRTANQKFIERADGVL